VKAVWGVGGGLAHVVVDRLADDALGERLGRLVHSPEKRRYVRSPPDEQQVILLQLARALNVPLDRLYLAEGDLRELAQRRHGMESQLSAACDGWRPGAPSPDARRGAEADGGG
jgi:hypothetical protein